MKKLNLLLVLLVFSGNVFAVEIAGVHPADEIQLGGQALKLNGAGLRTKFFFKVYVAALYLPQKQKSAETVISDDKGHRIALHMLRELSSEKLYKSFVEAIEANHSTTEVTAMSAEMKQMAEIFDAVKQVKEGDVITLDYLPGVGTQIGVNGALRGTIDGAQFNQAVLRIWLGNHPAQEDLKESLLGS
jgi:flagellar motor switch/type III secretory pathway protein FliN